MENWEEEPKAGDIFGIFLYGRIRNFGIVESCGNGIAKGKSLLGCSDVYFPVPGPTCIPTERMKSLVKDPSLLNPGWIAGMKPVPITNLPEEVADLIREAAAAMDGKSIADAKQAFKPYEQDFFELLDFVNQANRFESLRSNSM